VVSLASSVQHLANIVSAFKDDPDALWIVTSLFQLVAEIQYTIAFYLLEIADRNNSQSLTKSSQKKRSQSFDKERIRKILSDIEIQVSGGGGGSSSNESCVYKVIVLETVSNLLTMLTNHTQNALQAAGITCKGLVKTVLMRKLDQDLITGVSKCITAGFEVYKHFSAEKQFRIISQLSCPTEIDYSQLLKVSGTMRAKEGNWVLLIKYISNLATAAFFTLEKLGNTTGSESPAEIEGQIVLLGAAIRGDGSVLGISQILKKATKNRTPLKLSTAAAGGPVLTAFYDAESLSDVLRQVLMEALGELLESVERLPDIKATLDLLKNPSSLPRLHDATEEMKSRAGSVLRTLQGTLDELHSWNKIFSKCIKKTGKHLSGALHLVEALEKYLSLFKISDKAKREQRDISSQAQAQSQGSGGGTQTKAINLAMKLANEALSRSATGRNISDAVDRVFLFISSAKDILVQAIQHLETLESIQLFTGDSKTSLFLTQFQDYLSSSRAREAGEGEGGEGNTTSWMSSLKSSFARGIKSASGGRSPKEFPADMIVTEAYSELLEFKTSFEGEEMAMAMINSCTSALRFVIEASLHVEEFFETCHQIPFPEMQGLLTADHGSMLSPLLGEIKETMGSLVTGIGTDLGWCKPLAEAWQVCSSSDAMATIRQALPYLVGPGKFPERVEEAALVTLLDLELRAHQLLQSLMGGIAAAAESNRNIVAEVNRLIDEIRVLVSQAKACSTHGNVKRLLKQDKYREKVKHSIRETWQVIEGDIVLTHAEAFHNQECLRMKVNREKGEKSLSEKTGLIDIVHLAMEKNPVVERIEVTQDACREVLTGQGGVSGMARGLMTQLAFLKMQLEISVDMITDTVIQEDHRTGNEYLREMVTVENKGLMDHLQRTTKLPGYTPLPKSYNSITGGGDSQPCRTCGASRCPDCGIVSQRHDAAHRRVPYHDFESNDRQRALYDRSLSSANSTLQRRGNDPMAGLNSSSNGASHPLPRPSSANSTRRGGRDRDPNSSQPPLPDIYLGHFGGSDDPVPAVASQTSPTSRRGRTQQSSRGAAGDRNR
jgi:methyl-accepting chemotaxis protein